MFSHAPKSVRLVTGLRPMLVKRVSYATGP